MALKIDIIAPQIEKDSSALTLSRWMKKIGDAVQQSEPIAEVAGAQARGYIHAPAEGLLSSINAQPGQTVLSGALLGQISTVSKIAIDWTNFDQVTAILEDYAEKSKDFKNLKDANEALGQLLGVADKDVFRRMSIESQNRFLQNIVDQHAQNGLNPAEVAQKLLEGLQLRAPQTAVVRGPAVTSAPTPGGGGGARQQQGGWQLPPSDDETKQ